MDDEALWTSRFRHAMAEVGRVSGLYHDNYVVLGDGGGYVVRVGRALDRPDVERRMFSEASVLASLRPAAVPAPDLLFESAKRDFIVISYLPGRRVREAATYQRKLVAAGLDHLSADQVRDRFDRHWSTRRA